MKTHIIRSLFALLLLVSLPMLACAQSSASTATTTDASKAVATVRIDGGVIMLSPVDSGNFVTAQPNQPVFSGERLMVASQSSATIIYNDGCKQTYDKAGVYKIDPGCKRAAALTSSSKTPLIVGSVIAGAAVGAIIEKHFCHCHCPPVSR